MNIVPLYSLKSIVILLHTCKLLSITCSEAINDEKNISQPYIYRKRVLSNKTLLHL